MKIVLDTIPQYSSPIKNRMLHKISGKSWNDGLIMSSKVIRTVAPYN